jgi:hypothetical protein
VKKTSWRRYHLRIDTGQTVLAHDLASAPYCDHARYDAFPGTTRRAFERLLEVAAHLPGEYRRADVVAETTLLASLSCRADVLEDVHPLVVALVTSAIRRHEERMRLQENGL